MHLHFFHFFLFILIFLLVLTWFLMFLQVKETVAQSKGNLEEAELTYAEDRVKKETVDDPPPKPSEKTRGSGETSSDISELNRQVGTILMTIGQMVAAAVQRTPTKPTQESSKESFINYVGSTLRETTPQQFKEFKNAFFAMVTRWETENEQQQQQQPQMSRQYNRPLQQLHIPQTQQAPFQQTQQHQQYSQEYHQQPSRPSSASYQSPSSTASSPSMYQPDPQYCRNPIDGSVSASASSDYIVMPVYQAL